MAKNLEMTTTTINGPRGELNFIFHLARSQCTHSLELNMSAYKGSFGFDCIIFPLTVDCHFLLLQRKISTKNLTSTSAFVLKLFVVVNPIFGPRYLPVESIPSIISRLFKSLV